MHMHTCTQNGVHDKHEDCVMHVGHAYTNKCVYACMCKQFNVHLFAFKCGSTTNPKKRDDKQQKK